ncbi:MAG: response regulator, partial [Clostridium sp.]|nr:response regulator [Clostridium sp.]
PSALSAPAESELPVDLSDKRILLAEDNDLNREIIADLLANMGLAVDTAENGADAVEKFQAAPENYYAMILMDIQMPVMNGLEAAEAIRSSRHRDAEKIPIVALSANAFDEDIESSLCHGMQAHLSKPIDISELQKLFRQYLERRTEP